MKRRPHSQPREVAEEHEALPDAVAVLDRKPWPKWLTTEQAAIYLGKFRKKDGKPSVGAIRNMIYRKQIFGRDFFGRTLISRLELDQLIGLSPLAGGG